MNDIIKALNQLDGGVVLDAATGRGEFISVLKQHLRSYVQIIGIDSSEKAVDFAQKLFPENDVEIHRMNLDKLQFGDEYFDLVCLSNSLHHLEHREQVIAELLRVLKPGGVMLITEMYADGKQTPAQLTHIMIHHWIAGVDRLHGMYHAQTYQKAELTAFAHLLPLTNLNISDFYIPVDDPSKNCESLIKSCKDTIKRLESIGNAEELITEGKTILQRITDIGCASASRILITGNK